MKNKRYNFILFVFSIVLLVIPSISANNCIWTPSDIYNDDFRSAVNDLMDDAHITSCAINILNDFYKTGFGEQNRTNMAYWLLSASKMFTATAILQLYEQGLLGLNDNINDYLPYNLTNPYYPESVISIKNILSHHSSLSEVTLELDDLYVNGAVTFPSVIYEWYHENGSYYSIDHWDNWLPGTHFEYSDLNFDILALILENITSIPFPTYITNNILTPLGMFDTKHNLSDYSPENLALGYDWNITTHTNNLIPYRNTSLWYGCGGYYSTVEDMSKFMFAQQNQGEYNGARILNESTVTLMHTTVGSSSYGLGWYTNRGQGSINNLQGHGGGPYGGFCAKIYLRGSLGVVFLCNQGQVSLAEKINNLYAYIFARTNWLLNEKQCTIDKTDSLPLLSLISLVLIVPIVLFIRKKRNI